MRVSQKCDLVKGILVVLASLILQRITDASRMYHSVRGQETIKLYVIFNVLEVRLPFLTYVHHTESGESATDCRSFMLLVGSRLARLALVALGPGPTDGRHSSAYQTCSPLWPQSGLYQLV